MGHRYSIQRCLPLHGLAPHRAHAPHGDRLVHEALSRGGQVQVHLTGFRSSLDDYPRLPRRAHHRGQPAWHSLDLLGLGHGPIPLHCAGVLVGLSAATNAEADEGVRGLIGFAQKATVVSWLTYPVVYIFPMLGFSGAQAVVNIQVGYCVSDIISKCGVGLIIYQITSAKSAIEKDGLLA